MASANGSRKKPAQKKSSRKAPTKRPVAKKTAASKPTEKPRSKMDICRRIMREMVGAANVQRKDIVELFMKSAGLSKVASNTYYQLIKGELGTK